MMFWYLVDDIFKYIIVEWKIDKNFAEVYFDGLTQDCRQ